MNLSSSTSSSDDDFEEILILLPHIRNVRERNNPFDVLTDVEFKERFQFSKGSVQLLLGKFVAKISSNSERNHPVSPMNQLLIALHYYATGGFQHALGDHVNVNRRTVGRIVHRLSHYIALLATEYISMPETNEETHQTACDFYKISRFPGVLGAIGCTHIRIQSPGGNEAELYRNTNRWFSINVQVVCVAKLKIRDIVARWPGSVHNYTIFQKSSINKRMQDGEFLNKYLLGDSEYPCLSVLLTPYMNPQTLSEKRYNEAHRRTRNVIETCKEIWKRLFPVLTTGMSIKLDKVLAVIVASAVLHNFGISQGEITFDVDHLRRTLHVPSINNDSDESNKRSLIINTVFA